MNKLNIDVQIFVHAKTEKNNHGQYYHHWWPYFEREKGL